MYERLDQSETNGRQHIAYYRVSTQQQGSSGLGLEAQREAVSRYLDGGHWELAAEYQEIESGKRNDRPELKKALEHCKKIGATLIIAKLDRLARNVAFIATLMESKAAFVACDNPHANKLMLHMLAAFAEHERDMISARTKAALAAAKARGTRLGSYAKDVLSHRNREAAIRRAAEIAPVIHEMRGRQMSVRQIVAALNERGIPTARGRRWHIQTVANLLRRIDA